MLLTWTVVLFCWVHCLLVFTSFCYCHNVFICVTVMLRNYMHFFLLFPLYPPFDLHFTAKWFSHFTFLAFFFNHSQNIFFCVSHVIRIKNCTSQLPHSLLDCNVYQKLPSSWSRFLLLTRRRPMCPVALTHFLQRSKRAALVGLFAVLEFYTTAATFHSPFCGTPE